MRLFRKKVREEEPNYWQSVSDVMVALLLIVLLIMMLFILYMTRVPDPDLVEEPHTSDDDDGWGEGGRDWEDLYHGLYWDDHGGWNDHTGRGDGSGDGRGDGAGDEPGQYEYELPGVGDFEGDQKAAVFVTVRDGETGLNIRETGINFELFSNRRGKTALYDYYPQKLKNESYNTTPAGNFYLPEKIGLGSWWLRQISVPYGYDLSDDVHFLVEESHDWNDPYAVTVDLFPCRNVIRLSTVDAASGMGVSGAEYDIYAAADIITADGTLRYSLGQVVDHVICDQDGRGQSIELYLGQYEVRETRPPQFYAVNELPLTVFVDRKTAAKNEPVYEIRQERTCFVLSVWDELYADRAIPNASFMLAGEEGEELLEVKTDPRGVLELKELKKDTAYTLTQLTSEPDYQLPENSIRFRVGADGRIDGSARKEMRTVNRMIRVSIGVRDALLGSEVSDLSLALYDEKGELMHLWSSSALSEELHGLRPGKYTLKANGNDTAFTVEDTAKVQYILHSVWSMTGILLVSGAALLLAAGTAMTVNKLRKRGKKGKRNE